MGETGPLRATRYYLMHFENLFNRLRSVSLFSWKSVRKKPNEVWWWTWYACSKLARRSCEPSVARVACGFAYHTRTYSRSTPRFCFVLLCVVSLGFSSKREAARLNQSAKFKCFQFSFRGRHAGFNPALFFPEWVTLDLKFNLSVMLLFIA